MFNYLEEAKRAHAGFGDAHDKDFNDYVQTSALIAIAESLSTLTEQVKQITGILESHSIAEGFCVVQAKRGHYE